MDNWRIREGCNGRLVIRVVGPIRSSGSVRRRCPDACLLGCLLGRVLARMGDVGTVFLHSDYGVVMGVMGVMVDGY